MKHTKPRVTHSWPPGWWILPLIILMLLGWASMLWLVINAYG